MFREIHSHFCILNVTHSFLLLYFIVWVCHNLFILTIANRLLVISNFRLLLTHCEHSVICLLANICVHFNQEHPLALKCWIRGICKFGFSAYWQIIFQSDFTYLHFQILVNTGCLILFWHSDKDVFFIFASHCELKFWFP